jgi:hypothetical protein
MKTNSLHALPELHGDFTKRTHFSEKSLSRLSAILTFSFYPLPFDFFSKQTHFSNNYELRTKNFFQNEPISEKFKILQIFNLQLSILNLKSLYG